jgi:hypothetical protein
MDWYRRTLIEITEAVAGRCGERTAGHRHLRALARELADGGHASRETRQRLRQWSRRYRPRQAGDTLGRTVGSVVAAAALLESLEKQRSSTTSPVLSNVARLACVVGVADPFAKRLATGRHSYAEVCEQLGARV